MSSLLLAWLNDEVGISPPVTSFENDFASGYLFGQLFHRHNQQADFKAFVNNDKADSKINNFTRLEPTFRRLGVPFDSRLAQHVMAKKVGAACKLVYQVKAALTKIRAPHVGRPLEDEGVVKMVVVREAAPKHGFEALSKEMFEKSIRRVAENQNDVYLAEHMSKFGQGVEKLWEARDEAYRRKVEAHRAALLEKREQEQQKLRRTHLASLATAERGIQEWSRNQQVRVAQTQAVAKFRERKAVGATTRALDDREATVAEVASGIEEFEGIAASFGIVVAPGDRVEAGATGAETREDFFDRLADAVPEEALKAAAAAQVGDIRAKKLARQQAASVRQRRRVAFLQNLEHRQVSTLVAAREDSLVVALVKRPVAQVELEEQLRCVREREAVFLENRQFRSQEEQRQADACVAAELHRQSALYSQLVLQHDRDVEAALAGYDAAHSSRVRVEHVRAVALCTEVAWRVAETAIVMAQQRELRQGGDLPLHTLTDIGVVFTSGHPVTSSALVPPCADATGALVNPGAGPGSGSVEGEGSGTHPGPGSSLVVAPFPGVVVACGGVVGSAQDASPSLDAPTPFFDGVGQEGESAQALLDRTGLLDLYHRRGPWADASGPSSGNSGSSGDGAPAGSVPPTARKSEDAFAAALAAACGPVPPPATPPAEDDTAGKELEEHCSRRSQVASLYTPAHLPFVAGEVLQELALAVHPEPPAPAPPTFTLPVRAAILGPTGAGKRTQARRLAAAHHLEVIDAAALVRAAVESPGKSSPFASAAREAVGSGGSVPDAALVGLVLERVKELEERGPGSSGTKGWILVDFPRTLAQAQLLEQGLTGFRDQLVPEPCGHELWASLMAPVLAGPKDPHAVTWPHGLTVVLKLELPRDRVVRRLLGPRVPGDGSGWVGDAAVYHVDTAPPPTTLPARGQVQSPAVAAQGTLLGEGLEKGDAVAPAVDSWFKRGDVLVPVRCWRFASVEECLANGVDPALYGPLGPWATPAFDALNEDDLFSVVSAALAAAMDRSVARQQERAAGSVAFASDRAEVERARALVLATGYANACGLDHVPPPLPPVAVPSEGSEGKEEGGGGGEGGPALPSARSRGEGGDGEAGVGGGHGDAATGVSLPPTVLDLGVVVPRLSPGGLKVGEVLLQAWGSTVDRYGSQMQLALRGLRFERAGVVWRCAVARRRFAQFVRRPSAEKAAIVESFQRAFNAVDDGLRYDAAAKAELHARLLSTASALWDVVDAREAAACREVHALEADGWVAHTQQSCAKHFALLMRLESERFSTLYHILLDYFSVADGGRTGEFPPLEAAPEASATEAPGAVPTGGKAGPGAGKGAAAGKQPLPSKASQKKGMVEAEPEVVAVVDPLEEALAPATRAFSTGRALALSALRNVAKIRAAQDAERRARWNAALVAIATEREAREAAAEAAANAAKGGKGKPPAKAAPKAGGGKGGKGATEAPAIAEPNPAFVFINESVLDAVVYEAQQVVDRLEYLARRCRGDSMAVAHQGTKLFGDLQAAVSEAAALEGAAVEALVAHVGRTIEAHQRLEHSLRLEGHYFVLDTSLSVSAPSKSPAPRNVESASGRVLTASQLSTLVHALRSASLAAPGAVESGQSGYRLVPARHVVDVIDRLAFGGKLPADWVRVSPATLWAFVRDFQASPDLVDWQALCCSLLVGGHPVPLAGSGALPGGCAWRWMTTDEHRVTLDHFSSLDVDGEGVVPVAECGGVPFWFEGDGVGGAADALVSTASVQQRGLAAFSYPFSEDGWHCVTKDHPSAVAWRQAEAASTSHVAAIARQCSEVQDDNAVRLQTATSLAGSWSLLRRAILFGFADTQTSSLFPYQRILDYFVRAQARGDRTVYDRLFSGL